MSKTWLITGSSRGLGLEIARAALEAGDAVVATARQPEAVQTALGARGTLRALPLDVTNKGSVEQAVKTAVEAFGRIDVLVNNAGYGHFGPFEEATEEEVARQFDVNLFGAMAVTRAVLPQMRQQRSGRIFNISSIAGIVGNAMGSLYAGTKFAMEGWSESLALELEPLGIQVTTVEPGFFRTEFLGEQSVRYIEPRNEDHRAGAAAMREWLDGKHQQQEGDPATLAQILVELTRRAQQPLRLLMGSDAVERMETRVARDTASTEDWRSVSQSTDFVSTQ